MFEIENEEEKKRYQNSMYQYKLNTRNLFFSRSIKRKLVYPLLKTGLFKSFFRKKCPYSCGVIEKESNYFFDKRIAIYTGIYGGYDSVYTPRTVPDNCDYFVFSDRRILDDVWRFKEFDFPEELGELTNAEKNRYIKMHPHILFPDYDYSIYVDGSIEIITDLTELIHRLNSYGFALHKHFERNSAYEEIDECISQKKCSIDQLESYKSKLKREKFPTQFGLLEAPVLVREHHNPKCIDIMNKWWMEYKSNIKRDQLALIYILWKLGISPDELGTLGDDVHANYAFIHHSHN